MSNIIKAVVINDIHFGIDESQRLYNELHQFKDFLKANKEIKLCVIDGDYFDRKLSVVDTATYLATLFFQELVTICKEQHIILRMVQGTRSHELNQLQIFDGRQSEPGLDFKIIKTVQEEDILGLHVLYIPEEYPTDCQEYYKEFKAENKRYNVIFGHGTWDFVSFQSQIEHGNQTNTQSAPVLMWSEWKHTIPNGFISFGHIHGRNVYGNKIYYSGSFSRWGYGERSERGFTYFEYDLDNSTYSVKFIDNTEAPKYDSVSIKKMTSVNLNEEQNISAIQKAIEEEIKKADYMEVDLSGLSKENIAIIKKAYESNPNVKIVVKEKEVLLRESTEDAEKLKKYEYITKHQLPLDQTIQKYAKEELNENLDLATINEILKKE